MITAPLLDSYLGLHIGRICPNGNASDNDNHCAHFVSHVLSLAFGYTCGPSRPACMRVHEIFARCRAPEALDACRSHYGTGILFVTGERNVTLATQTMVNVPRKHGLEEALEYINDDELVECTPKAIRIRKRNLDHNERRRQDKAGD